VVQLHKDDRGDTDPGVDEAESRSSGVERLRDADAATDAVADFWWRIVPSPM
jgi:hypothetical protein